MKDLIIDGKYEMARGTFLSLSLALNGINTLGTWADIKSGLIGEIVLHDGHHYRIDNVERGRCASEVDEWRYAVGLHVCRVSPPTSIC